MKEITLKVSQQLFKEGKTKSLKTFIYRDRYGENIGISLDRVLKNNSLKMKKGYIIIFIDWKRSDSHKWLYCLKREEALNFIRKHIKSNFLKEI